jgi:hypothetical protein
VRKQSRWIQLNRSSGSGGVRDSSGLSGGGGVSLRSGLRLLLLLLLLPRAELSHQQRRGGAPLLTLAPSNTGRSVGTSADACCCCCCCCCCCYRRAAAANIGAGTNPDTKTAPLLLVLLDAHGTRSGSCRRGWASCRAGVLIWLLLRLWLLRA